MKKVVRSLCLVFACLLFAGLLLEAVPAKAAEETGGVAKSGTQTTKNASKKSTKKAYTGWVKKGGYTYYLKKGKTVKGWRKIKTAKYYFNKKGRMVTGTKKINGRLEVFRPDGRWISTASLDKRAAKKSSATNYLIMVSITKRVTKVYVGERGNWTPVRNILCTVGNPDKGWDTVRGTFYVGYSSWGNPVTRGYSFEDEDGHTLYYWTRFCDSFLFHSQLYDLNTFNLTPYENELGEALSHGCVRMDIKDARWIYNHVPDGSKVVVY